MGCTEEKTRNPPPISTTEPTLAGFVLYAERSIRLGECGRIHGGDLGVHAIAESRQGFQLTLGAGSIIDTCRNLFSPTVCLGEDVTLGTIHTNQLEDDSIPLRSALAFPAATMPPLPLARAPAKGGPEVTIAADEVRALLPGTYGTVTVFGTLLLNPGSYSFCSAVLADCARLIAITGDVQICLRDFLTVGRRVRIYPAFHKSADQLAINVSGLDTGGQPVASIGEHCFIRALLSAPHGTLAIADHTRATGAFAAFDIAVGEEVHVDFQCGFSSDAPGQRGSQQLQGY
jgi:hypothetical protein